MSIELRGHRRLRGDAKRRSRAGSTLVEVLIASVILTVAVGALFQAMIKADDLADATTGVVGDCSTELHLLLADGG